MRSGLEVPKNMKKGILRFPSNQVVLLKIYVYNKWVFVGQKVLFADMHGSPWRSWNANEMLHSRNMIMFLLNGLREMGWIMLCSADVSAKYHSDKNDSKLSIFILKIY